LIGALSANAASGPAAAIEQLNANFLQAMKAGKSMSFQQRYALLAPAIERAFDLSFIMQSTTGAHWNSLTPDRRQVLTEAFERYAVSICAAYFADYSGERFEIQPATTNGAGDAVVPVKIVPGDPHDDVHVLGYVMRQANGEWKAIDVMMDGQFSIAAVKRSEIGALLSSDGESGLLARLQRSAAALSDYASR
jgi:phospholipid transport system substrate-binding protein